MAGEIASAFVRIRPNMAGFKAETEAGVVGSFHGAFEKAAKMAGGVFAAAGIAEVFKHIVDAAAEHQAAFAVLGKSIENVGASTHAFGMTVDELLDKEARLKGFSDEELAQSMVRLVSVTHDTKKAFTDLGLAEDLSRARHINLATAALAISKAEQGVTTSLQRYGIVIPKVSGAVLELKRRHDEAVAAGAKFTGSIKQQYQAELTAATAVDKHAKRVLALRLIQDRFGGAADTFANTAAGQFERLRIAIHQTEVNIGSGLLPRLAGGAEGLDRFFTSASKSESLRSTFEGLGHDIAQMLHGVGDIAGAVGPPLLAVARAASAVVKAVGGTPILTAVVTYKALAVAAGLAASAQAAFASLTAKGAASVRANTAASGENAVSWRAQLGVKAAAAEADVAATGATSALTAAIEANTAAMAAQAATSRLAITGVSTFAAAEGAAATETAVLATAAEAEVGTMAALRAGLMGLASGLPLLGIALAGAAAGIVYLATRETSLDRTTKNLKQSLADYEAQLEHTSAVRAKIAGQRDLLGSDKLAVQQARIGVADARAAVTAPPGTLLYERQMLAVKQAANQLHIALRTLGEDQHHLGALQSQAQTASEAQRVALNQSASSVQDLAQAMRTQLAGSIDDVSTRFKSYESQQVRNRQEAKLQGDVVSAFTDQLTNMADKLAAQKHPLAAADVTLLEQFTERIGRLPTRKEVKVILGVKDFQTTLNDLITRILPDATSNMQAPFKNAGLYSGYAFIQGLDTSLGGAAGAFQGAVGQLLEGLGSDAKQKKGAKDAANAAADAATKAADATQRALDKAVADTKGKLKDVGHTAGLEIGQMKSDLADLHEQLSLAVTRQEQDIIDVVNQAKQNLTTIGSTIAGSIGDVLEAPIKKAQQEMAALANRQSLEQMRRSVMLPGGKALAADPDQALRQLNALQAKHGSNQAEIGSFITKYRTSVLAVRQDAVNATKEAATRTMGDLANALSNHRISPAQFQKSVMALLNRDHVNFKLAGKRLGTAFEEGFRENVKGLFTQAGLIATGPQRPGGGLAPTIVKPLDVLHADQREIIRIQKEISKKQTALHERTAKASEKTNVLMTQLLRAEKAAGKSNDKNPGNQSKTSNNLEGTTH